MKTKSRQANTYKKEDDKDEDDKDDNDEGMNETNKL